MTTVCGLSRQGVWIQIVTEVYWFGHDLKHFCLAGLGSSLLVPIVNMVQIVCVKMTLKI